MIKDLDRKTFDSDIEYPNAYKVESVK